MGGDVPTVAMQAEADAVTAISREAEKLFFGLDRNVIWFFLLVCARPSARKSRGVTQRVNRKGHSEPPLFRDGRPANVCIRLQECRQKRRSALRPDNLSNVI